MRKKIGRTTYKKKVELPLRAFIMNERKNRAPKTGCFFWGGGDWVSILVRGKLDWTRLDGW